MEGVVNMQWVVVCVCECRGQVQCGWSVSGDGAGASHVGKGDVGGHFGGQPGGEGGDLLMNVVEEGGGLPAAKFLNG